MTFGGPGPVGTHPSGPPAPAADFVALVKPKLRGWLHAGMVPLAVAAGIVVIALADGARERLVVSIYAVSAVVLFSVSATYHRLNNPRARAVLRRLDHASIYLIIAGTYTPVTYLLLDGTAERVLLWVVWIGAGLGIAFRVLWIGAPTWVYTPLYLALGWAAVFFLPDFARAGGAAIVTLIIVGGLLYTVGGVVYATKWPDPSPRYFGFHEVFHALTVAAFLCHYIAVVLAVVRT